MSVGIFSIMFRFSSPQIPLFWTLLSSIQQRSHIFWGDFQAFDEKSIKNICNKFESLILCIFCLEFQKLLQSMCFSWGIEKLPLTFTFSNYFHATSFALSRTAFVGNHDSRVACSYKSFCDPWEHAELWWVMTRLMWTMFPPNICPKLNEKDRKWSFWEKNFWLLGKGLKAQLLHSRGPKPPLTLTITNGN